MSNGTSNERYAGAEKPDGPKDRWLKWLLPLAGMIALAGFFGPWVNHAVSGLVVTGLDLGEYVKFVPAVRHAQIGVWRVGFYTPLVAVSLSFSLLAFRRELAYGNLTRALLLVLAGVSALNLLPPAWTPRLLINPEFRLQTSALLLCLLLLLISPMLGCLPLYICRIAVSCFCIVAVWSTTVPFMRLLPGISELYARALQPGWGMYLMAVGLLTLSVTVWLVPTRRQSPFASG